VIIFLCLCWSGYSSPKHSTTVCLGARQPDGLDDEVTGGQLWVEDQVVRHRAGTAERQHVAVLGRAGETADHWVWLSGIKVRRNVGGIRLQIGVDC
jgi:hypothetical protein